MFHWQSHWAVWPRARHSEAASRCAARRVEIPSSTAADWPAVSDCRWSKSGRPLIRLITRSIGHGPTLDACHGHQSLAGGGGAASENGTRIARSPAAAAAKYEEEASFKSAAGLRVGSAGRPYCSPPPPPKWRPNECAQLWEPRGPSCYKLAANKRATRGEKKQASRSLSAPAGGAFLATLPNQTRPLGRRPSCA